MKANWPRYEAVQFTTAVNVSSEDIDILNRAGLPKHAFGVGTILDVPVGVDVPGLGYLIRFAKALHDTYYYDPLTRKVLDMSDFSGQRPDIVNSTLEQFARTVKAIIEAFPFYDDLGMDLSEVDVDALGDMYEASAARLANIIRKIDPDALDPDSFWQRFLVDVMNGDYAAKDFHREESQQSGVRSIE